VLDNGNDGAVAGFEGMPATIAVVTMDAGAVLGSDETPGVITGMVKPAGVIVPAGVAAVALSVAVGCVPELLAESTPPMLVGGDDAEVLVAEAGAAALGVAG
jgi:hypothetical protein